MVKEMTGKELDELVETGAKVVCDFFATWCGPCRMLSPIMEELSEEFEGVVFAKVDVDKNGDLAASLNVFSIPDVFVFADGETKAHNLGFLPKEQMKEFLKNNL